MAAILPRRAFLGVAAVAAASACTGRPAPAPPPAGSPGGSPTRTPASGTPSAPRPPAGAAAADWTALGAGLAGELVRPADAGYAAARQLFDPRHDAVRPAGIACCTEPADVQECLRFATRYGVPVTARAGGHSYAGWSTGTGLVVDVTGMRGLAVDAASGSVTVGAGSRHADFYAGLAAAGVAVPAGSCPTVGLGGLVLGGGIGVLSRAYGLTSDNLLGAQVVTADGRIRECSADREQDLFWACRGGGGGNFGVATSFRLRTRPAPPVTLFFLSWPLSAGARVLDAWQRWAPTAPDELWSTCKLLAGADRAPTALAAGTYLGPTDDLRRLLDRLIGAVGADPGTDSVRTRAYLPAMLTEAGCSDSTVAQCHLPGPATAGKTPTGRLRRESELAASHFVARPVPAAGLAGMVAAVTARGRLDNGGEGGISLDALGGAVNRIPAAATAFVHRGSIFLAQLTTTWSPGGPVPPAHQRWLSSFHRALVPYANGEAYQNYVDPTLTGWQRAYYGANYPRLATIKAALDPGGLFRLPQSIR